VLEIWLVNRLATYGEQLSKLDRLKVGLLLDNEILENQIAEKSSFNKIISQAKLLNFGKIKNLEYIYSK
jgi:hypothetical protein